jgi:hypothetical protein
MVGVLWTRRFGLKLEALFVSRAIPVRTLARKAQRPSRNFNQQCAFQKTWSNTAKREREKQTEFLQGNLTVWKTPDEV